MVTTREQRVFLDAKESSHQFETLVKGSQSNVRILSHVNLS